MPDIKLTTEKSMFENLNISLPPNNEIVVDDLGNPSVMVKIPKFKYSDVGLTGSGTHHAFIIDGKEVPYIYISKYINIVKDGRAYSLPYQRPAANVSFDEAQQYCEAKGAGWHLMTNAEWAAIALWCKKHDCMPYGNNNGSYGDYYHTSDKGAPMPSGSYYYTATGSGPKDWFHNNDFSGIADLNGNVYEWVGGIRLNNGEINIIQNNNAAKHVDQSATSPLWKAIAQNGKLVAPGTSGALKYGADGITGSENGGTFKSLTAASGVTIPPLAKALALFPNDTADTYRDDYVWTSTDGEYMFCRGGYYHDYGSSGVFCFSADYDRSSSHDFIGFRSAYVPLQSE